MNVALLMLVGLIGCGLGALLVAVLVGSERAQRPSLDQRLLRVRLEAALAERRLHDLTREAFVTMAEQVERRLGDRR